MKINYLGSIIPACLSLLAGPFVAGAASGTWTNQSGGIYSATGNWLGGTVADGIGATADFSTVDPSAPATVTLDATHNLGALLFGNLAGLNADNWTLIPSGGSVLNLAVSAGTPTITVNNNGGNAVTATLNVPLTGAAGMTKTGNGTLLLGGASTYTGPTTISAGTLQLPAAGVTVATVPAPVLYLSFDNVTGSTINNEGTGGAALNGTLIGTATISGGGRFGGNALSIPATLNAGYVVVSNAVVSFSGSTAWTVGLWIKTATPGAVYLYQGNGGWNSTGGANTIFHLNNGGNNGAGSGMGLDSRGTLAGGVSYGRGWQAGSTTVSDGNWHYVVMTCDANNVKTSYVDGNVDAWSENTWAGLAGGGQVWIGGCGETGDGCAGLNGMIDQVSIYNTTLNQTQVQALMSAGTLPSASPLTVAANAKLDLNGSVQIVGGLGGSGTVDTTQSGGTAALVVNNSTASPSTFGGVLANTAGSLTLVNAGTNSLTLNGTAANTYTGATVVDGGSLIEDFANATVANNLINSSSPLVLGGGTLQVKQKSATTTAQAFAATVVNPGFSRVIGTQSTSGALTIALGALLQNPGGTVDFLSPVGGAITTTTANVNGILGGWATTGDNVGANNTGDWAANDGSGNIVTYTNYTAVSATASSTPLLTGSATQNWLSGSPSNAGNYISTLSASATLNSLVLCGDFNVPSGDTLTLGSGGLMLRGVSRWMLNNNAGNATGTGKLVSGLPTGELYVHVPEADANANNWTIWPQITDGVVPTTLYKDGPGLLKLGNSHTYTAGTVVNGGTLQLGNGSGGGATGIVRGDVTVNPGATLILSRVDSVGYNAGVCVSAINVVGGTLANTSGGNEGYLMDINLTGGTVTSTGGNYVFSAQSTPVYGINSLASPITSLFSGPVHFNGLGFFNVAQGTTPSGIDLTVSGIINSSTGITKSGAGAMLLSGANTFAGGLSVNAGTVVIGNTVALGTGALTLNGGAVSNNTGTSYTVPNGVNLISTGVIGVNAGDTLTISGVVTNSGGFAKVGAGTLKLTGADTYTGNTLINGGTLALTGSLPGTANLNLASGATFDVSGASAYTLGSGQNLLGSGTVNGSVTAASGAKIYGGTATAYGTNSFNNNLTLSAGALVSLTLGTVHNGSNSLIAINGSLANNNNVMHLAAPSASVALDTTADYVLMTAAGGISGTFVGSPVWDVAPLNAANFKIVTGPNSVTLHYSSTTAPTSVGTATPATLTRNQTTLLSVTVTPGTYPIASVVVDTSSLGGSAVLSLVQSNASNIYTNSVTVSGATATGTKSLTAAATDTTALVGAATINVTVVPANEVWAGLAGNLNWSSNPNWVSGAAPAFVGDSVTFAGSTALNPNLDNNYGVTGLTFDSTAGSFVLGASVGDTLTLLGGVTNNSTTTETLNLPITLSGPQSLNAAAGNLILGQPVANGGALLTATGSNNIVVNAGISGAGGLAKSGSGSLTLAGNNLYSGATTISAGSASISGTLNNSASLAVNNSSLNISGLVTNTAVDTVGGTAGSAVLNLNGGTLLASANAGQLYNSSLQISTTAGAAGDFQMTGGNLSVFDQFGIGQSAYGAFTQSGGVTTIGGFIALGGTAGGAVFNQSGGVVNLTGSSATIAYSATTSVAAMNLSGTAVFNANPNGGAFGGGLWPGEVGTGTLNVSGNASLVIPKDSVILGKGNAAGNGTLNLLGGVVTANSVIRGTGAGTLNFEGGTLKANLANPSFVTNLTAAYVFSGGAVIDDGGFPIGIPQTLLAPPGYGVVSIPVVSGGSNYLDTALVTITGGAGTGARALATVSGGVVTGVMITSPGTGYASSDLLTNVVIGGGGSGAVLGTAVLAANTSGGLVKLGAGALTLAAGNTYTGATRVLGGTLNLNPGTLITPGDLIVSNGAVAFDVSSGTSFTPANLVLPTNSILNLAYGTLTGNPAVPAIAASGALTVGGSNTIVITGSGWVTGQFPLISYTGATLPNLNNFKLGALPGITAVLVNNTANHSLDLNITRLGAALTWYGSVSGTWDFATGNWNNGSGLVNYSDGSGVTLDDTLYNDGVSPVRTNLNLTVTVQPYTLTQNSSLPYSETGTGGISGIGSVTINGSGSLLLGTSNSYSGGTFVNSGTLVLGAASALGNSPLTMNGGALDSSVAGLVNVGNNAQAWNGDFTFNGSQSLNVGSGAVTVNANRTLTINSNTLTVGGPISGGALNLTLAGIGTLALTGTNLLTGNTVVNSGALAITGAGNLASATDILIGDTAGQSGALYQSGTSLVANSDTGGGAFQIGTAVGASGYYKLTGGVVNLAGEINIGGFSGGAGTFGQLDLLGGTINIPNRPAGTYFLVNRSFTAGETAVVNILGGTVQVAGGGTPATTGLNGFAVNWSSTGSGHTATITIGAGGQVLTPSLTTKLNMGTSYNGLTGNSANVANLNLNAGGLLQTLGFLNGVGNNPNVSINFNGGTLKAGTAANAGFLANLGGAYVYGGGAILDDNGQAITIAQPLLAPTGLGITGIALADGGSGYTVPPQIVITDPTGTGATAYATINPVSGTVTGIVVTSPGTGYSASPSVSLNSGNYLVPATLGAITTGNNSSGGLTKLGAGTLTLTGADTYTGSTVVGAGELYITTASQASGSVTVNDGAAFGINLTANSTMPLASLTLGSTSTGTNTLDFGFGSLGNTTQPVFSVGTLTLNGTNQIRLNGRFTVGKIPLIKYTGSIAGAGHFASTLVAPQGVVAVLSNSVASSTLYAVITSTGPGLLWTGNNASLWDIGTTTNWLLFTTPTVYQQTVVPGDAVTFNDRGIGAVILNTSASPASILVSNTAESYTIQGSGSLGGVAALTKLGTNSLTLALTGDSYSGGTTISNGTVILGAANALGSGNLAISAPGTLELAGNALTLNGLSGAGTIDNNAAAATLTTGSGGSGVWSGSIHGSPGGVAWVNNGTSTLVVSGQNYLNGATPSLVQAGTVILTNGGVLSFASQEFWIAGNAASTGAVVVAGGTLTVSNNWLVIGRLNTAANGTLIVNSGTVQKAGANNIVVGSLGATGTLIVNGGQVLNSGNLWLGENAGASGTLYLNGGLLQATAIRYNGTTPATSAAYLNGGILQAVQSTNDFLEASSMVMSNGFILDDGGNTIGIQIGLTSGDGLNGGLVKQGTGTVYLDGFNSYTGATVVTNGTLAGAGTLGGPLVVGPAGNLGAGDAAGLGALTLQSTPLTLHGNATFRVDKTGGNAASDQIIGISTASFGGTLTITNITSDGTALAVGDTFQLFSTGGTGNFTSIAGSPGTGLAYHFNPASGALSVVVGNTIAPNPTNITVTVTGSTLNLAWPADHLGWILQAQTNSAAVGLSNNWVDITGSAAVTSLSVTVNPANPTVFYRLRHP